MYSTWDKPNTITALCFEPLFLDHFWDKNRSRRSDLNKKNNFQHSKLRHSFLTCNHLPPVLIQVRGNHVPHGSSCCRPFSLFRVEFESLVVKLPAVSKIKAERLERKKMYHCAAESSTHSGGEGGAAGEHWRGSHAHTQTVVGKRKDTPSESHHWSNVFSRPCWRCGLIQELRE